MASKLRIFWNKADTGSKWKIQVLDAVIRSKLLYGLGTIQLTDAEIARIDAYQTKCVRRI